MTEPDLKIQTRGAGPPLIMLHGWGLHSGIWAGLADELSQRYTLHMVDLPGHGFNRNSSLPLQADSVLAQLDQLPKAGWFGWSLGGLLALQAATDFSERVDYLILMAATPCFIQRPHWFHGMPQEIFENFSADLDDHYEQTLDRFLALEVHGAQDARLMLRRLKTIAASQPPPKPEALVQGLDMLLNTDLTGKLDQVSCPTAVIGGRRDQLVSPAAIEATAVGISRAHAHLIQGAGHAPHLGHRQQVAEIIDELSKRIQ